MARQRLLARVCRGCDRRQVFHLQNIHGVESRQLRCRPTMDDFWSGVQDKHTTRVPDNCPMALEYLMLKNNSGKTT